ncbi:MAG TPA: ribosome recycling factor [Corynebacteriales bacterium]|nr:ribosome recycling factor [Mycobacteriales bacterium]
MIDEILLDAEDKMEKTVDHTREGLSTIRAGRATAAMFNHVMADYYGVMTPITQMATINIPEARLVLIKPYEMGQMENIENAIRNSDLGFNPANDGQVLRINVPQLTEERRRELTKQARSKGEEGKIAVRGIRRNAMDELKKIEKDGDAGEDEVKAAEKDVDALTKKSTEAIDTMVEDKEADLMEV